VEKMGKWVEVDIGRDFTFEGAALPISQTKFKMEGSSENGIGWA